MPELVEYKYDSPMDFIETLREILVDGDGLTPERLVKDVLRMIENYQKETKTRDDLRKMFPGQEIHTLDIVE